jgi:hypothetical protein
MIDAPPPVSSLRIVSLNLWGGQAIGPLFDFVLQQAPQTDLFTFQEMLYGPELIPLACGFRTTLYQEFSAALPDFEGTFDPVVSWDQPLGDAALAEGQLITDPALAEGRPGRSVRIPFGLATFARRTLPVVGRRAAKVIEHQDTLDAVPGLHDIVRWLQLTELRVPGGSLLVANYHGIARPGTKLDTEERLGQSRAIRRILDGHAGPVVLIGDFNLLPDTESVRLLGDGLRNLVIERAIPSTRSRLNPYYGTPQEQPHADYAFVSPSLQVADFQVPDIQVSDHLPLLLDLTF